MKRTYDMSELSPQRALADRIAVTSPLSSPRTPPRSTSSSISSPRTPQSVSASTPANSLYPVFYRCAQDLQAMTPIAHSRMSYNYALILGMAGQRLERGPVTTLITSNCGTWPAHAECGETDLFAYTSAQTSALTDANGDPVVLLRVVIDSDGQCILALNGSGDSSIPFHNQMSFPPNDAVTNDLVFETSIKGMGRGLWFAGEIGFGKDGLIYYVSNRSGHFKPTAECFAALWDYLSLRADRLAPAVVCRNYQPQPTTLQQFTVVTRDEISQRAQQLSFDQLSLFADNGERTLSVKSRERHASLTTLQVPFSRGTMRLFRELDNLDSPPNCSETKQLRLDPR